MVRFLIKFIALPFFLLITYHLPVPQSFSEMGSLITAANAAGEFETSYKVTYFVKDDGQTDITQNITLKNKTDNYYADSFELKIGSTKVENVKAQDAEGPMETQSKFEDNITSISTKFNSRVIGRDKTLLWTITYTSGDLASKAGQIWEVSIPKLAKSPEISSYDAKISTPITFGEVSITVPNPKSTSRVGQIQEFSFDKDQLNTSGIAMSFGKRQVFALDLAYYLENNNLTSQLETITLPPDNNYQKVVIEKIDPPPANVTVDKDGNFLAKYKLSPKEQKDIKVTGYVEVFSKPFRNLDELLTEEDRELYTQPQLYWETDNAIIRDKAKELKTPQNIYNFVSEFLTYSNERLTQPKVERKGAAQAILSPKDSVCMEFTDLFIALSRAAGIPAREVEGYAFTQNERLKPLSLSLTKGDILHAWPQYWDDKLGWVQVDPTWGSTSGGLDFFNKLDFNHITFIQRGSFSTKPLPAGAYKRENQANKKNVFVEFAQELPQPTSTPQLSVNTPGEILSGIPLKILATVKNVGSTSIVDQDLKITASKLEKTGGLENPQNANGYNFTQKIPILPPYSQEDFTFSLQTTGLFKSTTDTLILSYAGAEISKPITISPIYKIVLIPQFVLSIVLAASIIAIGLYLHNKINKRKNARIVIKSGS